MTLTVDLIDSAALDLLLDMERSNLIRVTPPENTDPREGRGGEGPSPSSRIGFMKGRVSVPADFDTMGQESSSLRRRNPADAVEYCWGLAKRLGCTATSDDFLEQRRKDRELEDEQYRRLHPKDARK